MSLSSFDWSTQSTAKLTPSYPIPLVLVGKPMDCKIKLTWLFRGSRTEYRRNLIPSGLFYFRVPLFFFLSFFNLTRGAITKKSFAEDRYD